MKAMGLRSWLTVFAVAAAVVGTASGQAVIDKNRSFFSPDKQVGFGINDRGLHVQYAIGPAFHVGMNLALDFYKDSAHSQTYYDFGPYAKFLFSGGVVNPYAWAGVGIVQPRTGAVTYTRNPEGGTGTAEVKLPDTEVRLYLAVGGEHFFNDNVGVYGHVNLLDAMLAGGVNNDVVIDGGLLGGTVGIEFFF